MLKKPRRSEKIYGFTARDLAAIAGIAHDTFDKVDCTDLEAVMETVVRIRLKRDRKALRTPDDSPKTSRKPALPAFYSSFSLIYAHSDDEKGLSVPRDGDLEHAASQLRAFGLRAKVVDHWVQVGADLFCLLDARRILAIAEALGRSPARSLYSRCLATLTHAGVGETREASDETSA